MQELIVILACLNNNGCTESYSAYAKYNPLLIQELNRMEVEYKNKLGPVVTNYVLPMTSFAAFNRFNLRLDKHLVLTYSKNEYKLTFGRDF